MTTAISQQFSDLTKYEEEFGDSERCGYLNCGKTPTTHYVMCPVNDCLSRDPVCQEHAAKILESKKLGQSYLAARFHQCNHSTPLHLVHLFPK